MRFTVGMNAGVFCGFCFPLCPMSIASAIKFQNYIQVKE
jgi:formate hydrogenlyase subunit 6/NADH:ubiquinone oxidoreductase subunit I